MMADAQTGRRAFRNYRFLFAGVIVLLFFYGALRIAPYKFVGRAVVHGRSDAAPSWVVRRTRWAIQHAAHRLPFAKCLPQAMAAQTLLGLQGYASTIRIGVRRKDDGQIGAHAWLLCGDEIVVGDDQDGLAAFSDLVDLGRA